MDMIKSLATIGALLVLAGCATSGKDPKTNVSADTLRDHFAGRVAVVHQPTAWGEKGSAARAFFFNADGTTVGCGLAPRSNDPMVLEEQWKIVADERYRALIGYTNSEGEFDPAHRKLFYPVTVSERTGEYWMHSYVRGGWTRPIKGHVQDSWPAVMLERCPELSPPNGIPVNTKQTAADYKTLVTQDPGVFKPIAARAE